MERKKRTKKTDISRLIPVNIDDLSQSDDCFGKAWDPQHRYCSVCADVDICGVVFQERVVLPKKDKFDLTQPLDLANFEKVDWARIGKVVKKYQDEGEPMTYEELMDYIGDYTGMKDEFMIKLFMEKELPNNGLKCNESGNIITDA